MRRYYFILFTALFFSVTSLSFAAPDIDTNPGVSITSNPTYPGVGEETTFTFTTYGINTLGSTISWYIDGKKNTSFTNKTSITLPGISYTEEHLINAILSGANGTISREYIYSPSSLDIIIEPDTSSPAFYRGRSLLVEESSFAASALFHTKNSQKGSYSYEWRLGTSLPEIRNGQRVTFTTPRYADTLFVTVKNSSNIVVMEKATSITPQKPSLYLYAVSQTLGILPHALQGNFVPTDDSMSFIAHRFSSRGDESGIRWNINDTPVRSEDSNPYILTLSNLLTSNNATVNFSATYGKYAAGALSAGFKIIVP